MRLILLCASPKNKVRIKEDHKSGIIRVNLYVGDVWVQTPYRVLRVRHGLSAAGKRLWINHYKAAAEFDLTKVDLLIDVGANIGELSRFFWKVGKV